MPNPKNYKPSEKSKYMRDCMHQTMHVERKDKDRSLAQCLNVWRKHHPADKYKAKKSAEKVIKSYEKNKFVRNILTAYLNYTADYPKHPDNVVISPSAELSKKDKIEGHKIPKITEQEVWSFYDGIKPKILKELKGKNLFVRLKTDTGFIYVRHPFGGNSEFIRINDEKDFDRYNNGRIIEYHSTMSSECDEYVVDFDAVGDWDKTKKIVGEIADGLEKLSGGAVSIRYTGKRGFHILKKIKPLPIDKAREDLKEWLRMTFGDRDDLVVGESPSGSKGALGVSPMKLNGGQVALWSLRVTGLCCVEVPRASLGSFKREDASLEKTYRKLTGKAFEAKEEEKKMASVNRIVKAFQNFQFGIMLRQTKLACIGDSITSGNDTKATYVPRLQKLLGSGYTVENDGVNGTTLLKNGDNSYWAQGRLNNVFAFQPNIITINLGTNDTKSQNWDSHKDEFRNDYEVLIDTLNTLPTKPKILLVLPAPIFTNTYGIRDSALQKIISIIKDIGARRGLKIIDTNTPLRNFSNLFPDGVHPNQIGADLIADIFYHSIIGAENRETFVSKTAGEVSTPTLALLTWEEIRDHYAKKYGNEHHCVKYICTKCGNHMVCKCMWDRMRYPLVEEYGLCDECCKPETYECKACHKTNAYYKEFGSDCDGGQDKVVLYCPDCHAEN